MFDTTFIICAPEGNLGLIKNTVNSIKLCYPNNDYIVVLGKDATDSKEIENTFPTIKAGKTISSLINEGIKKGNKEWNFIVFEGSYIQKNTLKKYFTFVQNKKDVLYPLIIENTIGKIKQFRFNFVDGSMNGILIHQQTFKKVGKLTDNPLWHAKLFWCLDAIKNGCTFKGVLGTKVC